jgi:hypothetical protein
MRRWQQGRQGTRYRKLLLAHGRSWDLYVIDIAAGTSIPTHVDRVSGRRHWRMNLRLLGDDGFRGKAALRLGPLVVFRPDITPHSMDKVARRVVLLSCGFARP